ncbi:alanyl-tRNA editing protein, partial [uncultured Anaerotruncus sp.]|uniref:alanyl-tRNA editing protein n=1 Tax=uncultured Anaerotruncus sp. TaxID=905011 RepID=UPI00280C2838
MTDKLYEEDAYLREFEAEVTGCTQGKGGWLVTLDRTAFYPEGGGQPADTGTLGGARVLDVHEKEGEVVHTTDAPLPAGGRARGAVDWEARFSRMQQHTGEHIVSGIIHRLFGLDNVGFHMGHDAVTIDLNGELTADDLGRVERLANEAVWENLPVGVD